MPEFSFTKEERLSSRKTISSIFQSGRSIPSYPVRIIYMKGEGGTYPASVAISVPKRLFKRAVDRNLLKRRIREAYRKQKSCFYSTLEKNNTRVNLVIQYNHHLILDYQTIASGLSKGLDHLAEKVNTP